MLVLAFDPGYSRLGWGVVQNRKLPQRSSSIIYETVGYGLIATKTGLPIEVRLKEIYKESCQLIENFNPDYIIIEKLYFSRNRRTAAGVYQAQGVLFAASGSFPCKLIQLEPKRIKKALTGSGQAGKEDIMRMVCRLLNLRYPVTPDDTADALACAIAGILTVKGIESKVIPQRIESKVIPQRVKSKIVPQKS